MQLLDFYRSRFGQAVKRQGNGWNGPCPLCGGEPGKSDRFMVWPERSDNLGDACAKNGIKGIWSCRQCSASGDTIAYLMKIDGMTFKEALGELGIEGIKMPYRRRKAPAEPVNHMANSWTPKVQAQPVMEWQGRALKLVEEAEKKIWNNTPAIKWLKARGICEEAIRKYRIGYLEEESEKYHGRFRPRKSFGLPSKNGQDGRVHDKLFIPRGILIPTFGNEGSILNLRIRRHKADLNENRSKYMELEGSYHGPLFLPSSLPRPLAVYFITEAELDAMLIHYASGGVVGAVAVRTNRGKPDASCNTCLEAASRICVALDYDNAGAEGCDFWEEKYANSIRWPVPEGKDPGDAFALGVDIREWIEASLPASVSLQDNESAIHKSSISQVNQKIQVVAENGPLEAFASGQNNLGGGASQNFGNKNGNCPSGIRTSNADSLRPEREAGRQCAQIADNVKSFSDLELPQNVTHRDLLSSQTKHPLDDSECILPCPKTKPPFWWGYHRDCAKFKCKGHPQCLIGILRSQIFANALKEYKATMAENTAQK